MNIWIDAQLSPFIAAWINDNFPEITAQSVRALGLRDAADKQIFDKAKDAGAIIMTKDQDFISLLDTYGPPPKIIWITCGNTSNAQMRDILKTALPQALKILRFNEALVEISNK